MPWKCDVCDTFNEDSRSECFVCGQARSAASIREEELRKRREKLEARERRLRDLATVVPKWLFAVGLAAGLISAAILITLTIVNGKLDDVWTAGAAAAERCGDRVSEAFGENLPAILDRGSSGPIRDLSRNAQRVWNTVASDAARGPIAAAGQIAARAGSSLESGWENTVTRIVRRFSSGTKSFGAAIEGLSARAGGTFGRFTEVITEILHSAAEHFN